MNQTAAFVLANATTNTSWEYDTEAQLRSAVCLYSLTNPSSEVHAQINGDTFKVSRPSTSREFVFERITK